MCGCRRKSLHRRATAGRSDRDVYKRQDLDSIVRDIREAHLKDKTTADPQPTLGAVSYTHLQLFQVIGEPLVPDRQQAEEAGFASALTAYQTEHFLIFGAGPEYPPDSPQQEVFQHFLHIVALVRT